MRWKAVRPWNGSGYHMEGPPGLGAAASQPRPGLFKMLVDTTELQENNQLLTM